MEYPRYELAAVFPIKVIISDKANIAYDSSGHLLVKVDMWNVRQGLCTKALAPMFDSSKVNSIVSLPSS
jgi:hypothetical protein